MGFTRSFADAMPKGQKLSLLVLAGDAAEAKAWVSASVRRNDWGTVRVVQCADDLQGWFMPCVLMLVGEWRDNPLVGSEDFKTVVANGFAWPIIMVD